MAVSWPQGASATWFPLTELRMLNLSGCCFASLGRDQGHSSRVSWQMFAEAEPSEVWEGPWSGTSDLWTSHWLSALAQKGHSKAQGGQRRGKRLDPPLRPTDSKATGATGAVSKGLWRRQRDSRACAPRPTDFASAYRRGLKRRAGLGRLLLDVLEGPPLTALFTISLLQEMLIMC